MSSRAGQIGWSRRARLVCHRLSRSARSTWSTSGRCDGPGAVPRAQPVRAQRGGDADADDTGGMRRTGRGHRRKLNAATGPMALFIPRGVSRRSRPRRRIPRCRRRPGADRQCWGTRSELELQDLDCGINDPGFSRRRWPSGGAASVRAPRTGPRSAGRDRMGRARESVRIWRGCAGAGPIIGAGAGTGSRPSAPRRAAST